MSSEQKYDYFYEEFVEDSPPALDLFGESAGNSNANFYSFKQSEDTVAKKII